MSEEEHNEGPLLEARLEGKLLNKVTLLPWNLLLFLYNTKVLKVEVLVTLTMLAKLFSMRLSEQYYYHTYGSDILRNTSFSFPDGPFCVTSDLIDAYTGSNHSYKLDESKSNHLAMYAMVAYTVPAVVMTVVLGSVTDRFGRKIGMIVPTLGLTLETFLAIIIVVYNLNPYYFILSSFTGGCFGSLSTILASSFSYVADISSPRWRSLRIGIVEAGVAFGGSAGQFFVGLWLDRVQCNYLPPLYFIAACFTFIAVYIVFFIPESLSYEKRQELQSKNRRGLRAYMEGFELFCGTLSLRTTWKLYVATIAMNVLEVNVAGDKLVSMYILKALPFDFNPFQIGIYQALRSASQGLANLVVMGVLVSLKLGDIWIIVAALVMHITGNLLLGFSRLPWEFYTIAAVKGFEGLVWPGGRGFISKLVRPEKQGALFSITGSIESLAVFLASVIWPLVFPLTLQHNMRAGTTYFFMAAVGSLLLPPTLSLLFLKKEEMVQRSVIGSEQFQSNIKASSTSEESKPLLYNTDVIVNS